MEYEASSNGRSMNHAVISSCFSTFAALQEGLERLDSAATIACYYVSLVTTSSLGACPKEIVYTCTQLSKVGDELLSMHVPKRKDRA